MEIETQLKGVTAMSTIHWSAPTATSAPTERSEHRGEPLVMSVEEAARLLGISRGLAYELARRGDLPCLRLGRRMVVPRVALLAMIAASPLTGPTTAVTGYDERPKVASAPTRARSSSPRTYRTSS
jgi:excisionase family DNA binding protein